MVFIVAKFDYIDETDEIIFWSKSKLNFTSCYGNSHDPASGDFYQFIIRLTKTHRRAKGHQILVLRGKPKHIVDVHAYISEIRTSYPMLPGEEKVQSIRYDPSRINVIAKFAHENVNFAAIYRRD